ncbi:MAG: sigma-70 family RNA polymerase sigma factor [Acidobacteria bacterium]|nr:sigma-70 family RNA polymerase sigma factor [Acidobacteriota bacterium]
MHAEETESVGLRSALESVIGDNGGKWFRFILGILRNEADAEDVIQEAVRRVLTRNRSFPSREDVRLYLGRAIGNTAFEMYNMRKRDRRRNVPLEDSNIPWDRASGPDAFIEAKEENGRMDAMLGLLDKALKRLPEKQEHAVRITILDPDGLSLRNVGEMYKIPYSTLRHRHKKGLERMRSFLEQSLSDE